MAMSEQGICLVGYGGIAAFHAEALHQLDGVGLNSVVGRRPQPTQAFCAEWSVAHGTTDYAAALARPDTDAVIIAAPSELHYEMTVAALMADKDVLVEIPLAMSAEGGRRIAQLAAARGRQVMVAHTRRYESAGRFVHDFLRSGQAGQIHQHHTYSFWLRHENVGWTGYRRSWVDDVLFHHGCHLVDFSLWCVGDTVKRVNGELSPLSPRTGTSMDVSMLLRYTGDTMATISLSYSARPGVSGQVFVCEKGTLEVGGSTVRMAGETIFEASAGGLHAGVVEQDRAFLRALCGEAPAECAAAEALAALEVLQAVYDQMVTQDGGARYRRPWGL
jgi:2-hydroxy-4-carboxymuconate semialdehyde hemiacetal dehydrogenase